MSPVLLITRGLCLASSVDTSMNVSLGYPLHWVWVFIALGSSFWTCFGMPLQSSSDSRVWIKISDIRTVSFAAKTSWRRLQFWKFLKVYALWRTDIDSVIGWRPNDLLSWSLFSIQMAENIQSYLLGIWLSFSLTVMQFLMPISRMIRLWTRDRCSNVAMICWCFGWCWLFIRSWSRNICIFVCVMAASSLQACEHGASCARDRW